ncbi:MAG: amino acid adenylation domain-containing protein [Bacteroidetes bacterium]|nr:amino acid adenylation domain-containing protein [Bacteroidota bacterium]
MSIPHISRRNPEDVTRLSFGQQRLWFLDQLDPGRPTFSIPAAYQIDGSVNFSILEECFSELVRRHESLRTHFGVVAGEPVQLVVDPFSVQIDVVDLSVFAEKERESEALRRIGEESMLPFDISTAPLFRVKAFLFSGDRCLLFLCMHHAISDGWSMKVLFEELSSLYGTISKGKPSRLPEPEMQYGDFSEWQHDWLQEEELREDLDFWTENLKDVSELELPTDICRSDIHRYVGASESIELSKEQTNSIKRFSANEAVTVFMTLLATYKILLFRYSGQEDIVVGAPISGRNRLETEQMIGLFLNMIPLRTQLTGDLTFLELLKRVRGVNLDAYVHQNLPFEKLIEVLSPERNLDREPIISSMVNFLPPSWRHLDLDGMVVKRLHLENRSAHLPLSLYVGEESGRLFIRFVYQSAIFSSEGMKCIVEQYEYLLEQIIADPEKRLSDYSLVTVKATTILPNPTQKLDEPYHQPVPEQFLSKALITPAATAISCGDRTWSYLDLEESSRKVATELLSNGLEKGDVVAVDGSSYFALVACILGVIRSAGVLLILDSELPNLRKEIMLEEAAAKWTLTPVDDHDVVRLCTLPDSNDNSVFIHIERSQDSTDQQRISDAETANELPVIDAAAAAYIFFTSGTTGIPKGVLGSHKGLSHFLDWQRESFDVGPDDRVALLSGLSFDPVLRDIFLPLTSGATLCIPETGVKYDSGAVLDWLEMEKITIVHAVPTIAQLWLSKATGESRSHTLRHAFFAGEVLTDDLVKKWRRVFPGCEINNIYGPTETTLVKCCYRVPTEMREGVQPLGTPLPQTQILIMTEYNQMCGFRESGEIVIRTPFRSIGYVNENSGIGRCFEQNPFRLDDSDLLYYTGDSGRYCADGTLEILGRLDDQIKIHGVRIEPDEITASLTSHPDVESCIVIVSNNENGDPFLTAYIVAETAEAIDRAALRTYLSERLPSAMIPASIVFLSEMPFTPNGKVDRKALPAPDEEFLVLQSDYVTPRSPEEEKIASIWREILGREQIGAHQNFFDLGGHSLAAVQVINRLRHEFNVELPLRVIFEAQTVSQLAARISAGEFDQHSGS